MADETDNATLDAEDSAFTWGDVETWSDRLGNLYRSGKSIYDSTQEPDAPARTRTILPNPVQPAADNGWIKWVVIGVAGLVGLGLVMKLTGGSE